MNGRFTAEDVVKGNGTVPETLNRYGYCWGNLVPISVNFMYNISFSIVVFVKNCRMNPECSRNAVIHYGGNSGE